MKKLKNKANNNRLWIWLAILGAALIITLFLSSTLNKAHASVSYPDPTIECVNGQLELHNNQKFSIGIVAYRWHVTSQTSTTVTYQLQLDINPTNNETWVNVPGNIKRTLDKLDCTPPPPVDPCNPQILSKVDAIIDPCITPTPTPEPCLTNCNPVIVDNPPKPFVCTDGKTASVVANPHVYRNGEEATVNFFITEGNKADILYGEVGNHWQHAVRDLTPNGDKFVSYTIHGLDPNLGYDFGIVQRYGCGGGDVVSVIVDGPTAQLFRLSYLER